MEIEHSVGVRAPLEGVWSAMLGFERVVPHVPGAAIEERLDERSYRGVFRVMLGPTSAVYTGTLSVEEINDADLTMTIRASGTDRRGQGGAEATVRLRLAPGSDGEARLELAAEYEITGRLAHYGRDGTIDELATTLLAQFAAALEADLTDAPPPAPVDPAPVQPTPVQPAPVQATPAGPDTLPSRLWARAQRNRLQIAALILGFLLALRVFGRHD